MALGLLIVAVADFIWQNEHVLYGMITETIMLHSEKAPAHTSHNLSAESRGLGKTRLILIGGKCLPALSVS